MAAPCNSTGNVQPPAYINPPNYGTTMAAPCNSTENVQPPAYVNPPNYGTTLVTLHENVLCVLSDIEARLSEAYGQYTVDNDEYIEDIKMDCAWYVSGSALVCYKNGLDLPIRRNDPYVAHVLTEL
jgi:hypothetical protein